MKDKYLLYGAYGYTGKLIIEEGLKKNIKPILSGRNEEKLKHLAEKYKLDFKVFDLTDKENIEANLREVKVVMHAAGPFIHTASPMVEACLATHTHYTDITGEYQVFEQCAALHDQALQSKIMLLPGAGFDVVPSDCLALFLKKKLPKATSLMLAFAGMDTGISRGTSKTMIENLGNGGLVRADHKLKRVPNAFKIKKINFGKYETIASTIPWGDLSTAYRSTGIPNIEVYMGMNEGMIKKLRYANYFGWLLKLGAVKSYMKKSADGKKEGPDAEKRSKGKCFFYGQVQDDAGLVKEARLSTPEGYSLTALTSVNIVEKVLNNKFKIGYQTPATAYGHLFILEIPNCKFF